MLVQVSGLSSEAGIEDVSFEVRRGEIVGMAGLVGAGRTEVARAIFGVDTVTAGRVILEDRELNIGSPADAIDNGIALLTEDRKRTGLCLELPCSWNITLPNLEQIGFRPFIKPGREVRIADDVASRIGG